MNPTPNQLQTQWVDTKTCLHLHLICTECDYSEGHCHCNDGGEWFCQDCNTIEYHNPKIRDTVDLINPYTWYEHKRRQKQ